jgi:hypothetical protein
MKWMRLKMHLIPCVIQEVDSVTEIYISKYLNNLDFINELRKSHDKETMTEFLELRESVLITYIL